MFMNKTFLKLFWERPGRAGESRGQAAGPAGEPGAPAEETPGTRHPPHMFGMGPFRLSLEAPDGTVHTSGGP